MQTMLEGKARVRQHRRKTLFQGARLTSVVSRPTRYNVANEHHGSRKRKKSTTTNRVNLSAKGRQKAKALSSIKMRPTCNVVARGRAARSAERVSDI